MQSSLPPRLSYLVLLAGSLALWLVVTFVVKLITFPPRRAPRPSPPTPELRSEPPAVVNLLMHRGDVTSDAAKATVLDLAARRVLELEQPGNDPGQTTIWVRDPNPRSLARFEQRVLDRVKAAAGEERVPLAELSRRHAADGLRWGGQFRHEVKQHAKELGLVAKPLEDLGNAMIFLIVFSGMLGCVAGTGAWGLFFGDLQGEPGFWPMTAFIGILAVALVGLVLGAFAIVDGYRETRTGLTAIAEWSGVEAWLRGHEAFADLPPAGVTVWDRYLAHGVALGANPLASDRIDLSIGREDLLWTVRDGRRQQIRVRYPRFFSRYGRPPIMIIFWAVLRIAACAYAISIAPPLPIGARWAVAILAVAIVPNALYRIVRALGDLLFRVTVTGTVLSRSLVVAYEDVPARYVYLVVDDGRSVPLRSWTGRLTEIDLREAVSYGVSMTGGRAEEAMKKMPGRATTLADCAPGMVVRLRGYPYARRIISLEIL